jgi:hypothetical protein
MIRYNIPILILSLIIGFSVIVSGQSTSDPGDGLAEKFRRFCEEVPWEEVFVNTDRDDYMAGEELWMSTWLVDRATGKLSENSRIIYIELLNPDNRPVVQKRFSLEYGRGAGLVILPDTLSPGEYTLRAYTNWMKNFPPDTYFSRKLNIYNALSNKEFVSILNIPSAFSASPENTGRMTGFSAEIIDNEKEIIEICIKTDIDFLSNNGNNMHIFIHTGGKIDVDRTFNLTDDSVTVNITEASLSPGLNHLTIFNSIGKPLFERYLITRRENDSSYELTCPAEAGLRSRVTVGLTKKDGTGQHTDEAHLSISAAPVSKPSSNSDIVEYFLIGSQFGSLPDNIRDSITGQLKPDIIDKFLRNAKSRWIDWELILSGKLPEFKYKIEKEYHYITGKLLKRETGDPDPERYVFLSVPGKTAGFQYAKTDREGFFNLSIPISQSEMDFIIQPEGIESKSSIRLESSFSEEYLPPGIKIKTSLNNIPFRISDIIVNYQVSKIYGSSSKGEASLNSGPAIIAKRFYGKPDIELRMDDYIKLPVMEEVFFELLPGVTMKKRRSGYEIEVIDPVNDYIYDISPGLFIDGVVVNDASVIADLDPELVEQIDVIRERYLVGQYVFYGLINIITRRGDYSNVNLPDNVIRLAYRVTEPVGRFASPDYTSQQSKISRIPDFRNTLYWDPDIKTGPDGNTSFDLWTSDQTGDFEINIQGIGSDGRPFSCWKIFKVR